MAIYRNISMSFWTDSKVDDDFTPEDKYFYLYLLTNPHTNICGCFEISMKQMCRETGYNEDTVRRLLDRMEHQHAVVRYSHATKEVLIVNWHKYNWTKSEKMLSGVVEVAKYIKNPDFRLYISEILASYGIKTDTISIGYTEGMETSVSVTVSDTEENPPLKGGMGGKRKAKEFVPPTLEEVQAYCKERNSSVDPKQFHEYFTVGDWKDSEGKPVKNWKQKLLTWEKMGSRRSGGTEEGSKKPFKYDYGNDADTLPF